MNNPAASGGESAPEEIEALEPPFVRARGRPQRRFQRDGAGRNRPARAGCRGRSGRRLFQPTLPPSRASSTALGGVAADAVADGLSLGDLRGAAVAGVDAVAVLHGGPRCGD
jgi:hypothetical protein